MNVTSIKVRMEMNYVYRCFGFREIILVSVWFQRQTIYTWTLAIDQRSSMDRSLSTMSASIRDRNRADFTQI